MIHDWFFGLGAEYRVNPYIFGSLYVGAIPFFVAAIAWLVRRRRQQRSITVPALCAGMCFVSAYVYLAIVGRNIPPWVWMFIAVLIIYGTWSTIRDVKRKSDIATETSAAKTEERPE